MSEDGEKECRLTYREGREIAEEATKPYERAAFAAFAGGMAIMIMIAILVGVDSIWQVLDTSQIDALLDKGEISEAVADFLKESRRSEMMNMGFGGLAGGVVAATGFTTIGDIMRRRALEEANERKGP